MDKARNMRRIWDGAHAQLTPIVQREILRHRTALQVDPAPGTPHTCASTVQLWIDGRRIGSREVETPRDAAALSEDAVARHRNACAYAVYGLLNRWYAQRPETIAARGAAHE